CTRPPAPSALSLHDALPISQLGSDPVHTTFIRGPVVEEVGADAAVLASLEDGRVVAVEQGNLLGISFHPELSGEPRLHQRFLNRDRKSTRLNSSHVKISYAV